MYVAQTATDYLKAYFKTIPLGEEMLKRLPISIYGNHKTLNIKLAVGVQIDAKRQKKFNGGYGAGRENVVKDFVDVTLEDIKLLEDFYKFMKEVFGSFDRESNSLFYKATPFGAFYRIWYDNREHKNLVKLFKKVFASNVKQWEVSANGGGRSACLLFYLNSISVLRRFDRTKTILSDTDTIQRKEKEREIALVKQK